jgi:hypothetical protein
MADERSVDVDEPRDPPPAAESPQPAISAGTRLSPVQEAYGDYTGHAIRCPKCRDIDRDRCTDGEQLWHAYQQMSDQAYRRLQGS